MTQGLGVGKAIRIDTALYHRQGDEERERVRERESPTSLQIPKAVLGRAATQSMNKVSPGEAGLQFPRNRKCPTFIGFQGLERSLVYSVCDRDSKFMLQLQRVEATRP